MAKEIWNSNESVVKHRPQSAPAQAPKRRDPWGESHSSGTNKWLVWGGIALIVILLFVFFIRPAWVGYRTYSAMQESGVPSEYALNMAEFQTRTEAAEAKAEQADAAAREAQSTASQAVSDRDTAKAEYDEYIASFQADSATKTQELSTCQENLEAQEPAIADAARRICCMQRVDNPAISGYEIQDQRIVCVEDGGENINC